MNRKSHVAFGPGAASLILIVVVLSLSILGMLSLLNAHNDARLEARSAEVVSAVYDLNNQSERSYAALDEVLADFSATALSEEEYTAAIRRNLPTGMRLEGNQVTWTETDGVRTLDCAVLLAPLGDNPRMTWYRHRLSAVAGE